MPITNNAAWIEGKGSAIQVGAANFGIPGPGEVLIKNHAVAFNPVDVMMQDVGAFVQKWPAVFGEDVAGEVAKIGEGVSNLSEGQRVLAYPIGLATGNYQESGFQNYTLVKAIGVTPLPDNITFEQAAVIPLALATASAGLYQKGFLELPLPSADPKKTGKTLIVWGGSSSVGSQVIQLAVASGFDIITTASPRNFEYCKKLGAKQVFDYNSPGVVGDLRDAVEDGKFAGAYDAISHGGSTLQLVQVVAEIGGGTLIVTREAPKDPIPATVDIKGVFAPSVILQQDHIGKAIFTDFLPKALASGQFIPAPDPQVVGEGLQDIQKGIDTLRKGVSASKIVVKL